MVMLAVLVCWLEKHAGPYQTPSKSQREDVNEVIVCQNKHQHTWNQARLQQLVYIQNNDHGACGLELHDSCTKDFTS